MQIKSGHGIWALSAIMLVLFSSVAIFIGTENASGGAAAHARPLGYTPHDPCRINGNAEFSTSPCRTGGSGTQGDPYVIEGWDIDGSDQRYALYIGNTTSHFIARANRLHNASGVGSAPYYHNAGLILLNVSNGLVENNLMTENAWIGAYLVASNRNEISNNTISHQALKGIYLDLSGNNTIKGNIISGTSTGDGIHLSQSFDNDVILNKVFESSENGIYLYRSHRNVISENNAYHNRGRGVYLQFANNKNALTKNLVKNNTLQGIYLDESNDGNDLSGNIVCGNTGLANIELRLSNENAITGNRICDGTNTGLALSYSEGNRIAFNAIVRNANYGISLSMQSINNAIHNNDFQNNSGLKQAFDDFGGNAWNDTVIGNHWTDFDEPLEGCFDSDINGICDSPYDVISHETVSDHYPIVRITLPSAPINLVAKPGDKKVDLTWLPPEKDGWSEITNYNIFRNGTLLAAIDDALNYADTGLVNGVEYRYKVSAINMAGEGRPSNEVSAVPFGIPPIIVNTSPRNWETDVAVDAKIVITFSRAMDRTSTYNAIAMIPSIQWKATWRANDTVLTLTPSSNLQADTSYNITISTAACDINGTHMKDLYTFSFRTALNYDPCMLAIAVLLLCGILLIYFIIRRRRKARLEEKRAEVKKIGSHEPKTTSPSTDADQAKKRAIERVRQRRGRT